MKKLVTLGLILFLLSTAGSAQNGIRSSRDRNSLTGEYTRMERLQLQRDAVRYRMARHHAQRDGRIGPIEKRRLHRMKACTRRRLI